MGEAAGSLSDLVVLTSDNPRSEDPLRIINDVVVGLQKVDAKYRIEPDARTAIEMALEEARAGRHRAAGRQRATKLSRCWRTGRLSSTIARRRERSCAARDFRSNASRAVAGDSQQIQHSAEFAFESEAEPIGDAMRWTVVQVAEALGVPAPAGLDPLAGLAGVSIDSRTVQPGELFIAIRGPRHDGHGFVAGALAGGAAAGVVARERSAEYPEEIRGKLFAVDDTLAALQRLAAARVRNLAEGEAGRTAYRGGGGLGRQNHHERNSGGARGRAVPRAENAGQSEQRVWVAADAAEARRASMMRRWSSWECRIAGNWRG